MNDFKITTISKGEKFPLYVPNTIGVIHDANGFTFVISFPGLRSEEIKAFLENDIKITLSKANSMVAFFGIDIKNFFLGEVAFNILKTTSKLEDVKKTNIVTFILVDEYNSIVEGIRVIGVSNNFIESIASVCKEQTSIGLNNYEQQVLKCLETYTTQDIIKMLKVDEYISGNNK